MMWPISGLRVLHVFVRREFCRFYAPLLKYVLNQLRTRLHHKDAFGGQPYSTVGCMTEATTTLTRAASP